MWDWLTNAANRLMQMDTSYLQQRAFIFSLCNMAPQQANWVLKQRIEEMDDAAMTSFSVTLSGMIGEAQQAAQTEAQAGFPASQGAAQAQRYLQSLNAIAYYANQFYQERLVRTTQPPEEMRTGLKPPGLEPLVDTPWKFEAQQLHLREHPTGGYKVMLDNVTLWVNYRRSVDGPFDMQLQVSVLALPENQWVALQDEKHEELPIKLCRRGRRLLVEWLPHENREATLPEAPSSEPDPAKTKIAAAQGAQLSPLTPKPGCVIGRIVDTQGQPITHIEITIVGTTFANGENVTMALEPDVNPRTGYYEIEVPDGLYRVHASFNKRILALRPQTTTSMLNALEEFVPMDGKAPNAKSSSKQGIVKDFVWMPSSTR
jgi:hypothetical protein